MDSFVQLVDIPKPSPGPGEVLVKIKAAGVNPVETYIRAGTYAKLPTLPYTPGGEGTGDVEAVGEDVTRYKVSMQLG
jgi:NADPH2:quinone reductase